MNEAGNLSHTGDLCPVEADSNGNDAWWGVHAADKPDLFGTNNVSYKSMVLYEKGDDFGNDPDNTFASTWWGTGCEPIACCNIQPYKVVKDLDPVPDVKTLSKDGGRRLYDLDADVELFTVEEYREFFGEEPHESEYLQN